MATLHLIVGLPCSGKTTLARKLERDLPALRLTPDEWIVRLFGAEIDGERLDAMRDPVESALWDLAARVLVLGVDVILDFGFWSRAERDDYRMRAEALGASSEVHFLDVPQDVLLSRLTGRNRSLPHGTFHIDEDRLMSWLRMFEPLTAEELRKVR